MVLTADNLGNAYVAWDVIGAGFFEDRSNWASPFAGLGISGPTDPVRVPAEGMAFDYTVSLVNYTSTPLDNLIGWLDATLPDGTTTAPLLGPRTITVQPGFFRQKTLRLRIPGWADPGEYLINLRIAGPTTDQNRMCIIKE